jgi:hypothetical protein
VCTAWFTFMPLLVDGLFGVFLTKETVMAHLFL